MLVLSPYLLSYISAILLISSGRTLDPPKGSSILDELLLLIPVLNSSLSINDTTLVLYLFFTFTYTYSFSSSTLFKAPKLFPLWSLELWFHLSNSPLNSNLSLMNLGCLSLVDKSSYYLSSFTSSTELSVLNWIVLLFLCLRWRELLSEGKAMFDLNPFWEPDRGELLLLKLFNT